MLQVMSPLPGSKIDWSYPLSGGLGYFWACNEYSGRPMSLRESLPSLRNPISVIGTGGEWGSGGYLVNNGGLNYPRYNAPNLTSSNFSVMMHLTVISITGTFPGLISARTVPSNLFWSFNANNVGTTDDVNLIWFNGAFGSANFPGSWAGLGTHCYLLTREPTAPQYKLYVDGKLFGDVTNALQPPFITSDTNWGGVNGLASYSTAIIHSCGVWVSRTLSSSDAQDLWNDPWAIIRPRSPLKRVFALSSPLPSSTVHKWKPWMYGRNQKHNWKDWQ